MIETVLLVLVLIVALGIIVFLERRSDEHEAMFSRTATPIKRLVALVLGIVSAGAFLSSLASGSFGFLFLILALALIGYAFGARGLMNKVQGRSGNQDTWKSEKPNRVRVWLWVVVIILAVFIYVVSLAVVYPDSPLTTAIVIILFILFIIGVIRSIISWSKFF